MPRVPPLSISRVREWQDGLQQNGSLVWFTPAGGTARQLRARVEYLSAVELANAIEAYPIRVHFDARDFASGAPAKGDTVTIENARRGVMSVHTVTAGPHVLAYRCGVSG